MEWKKDNTDSEKLKLMEKEYIEAALRMMKRAGITEAKAVPLKTEAEEEKASEEIHIEAEAAEEEPAEEVMPDLKSEEKTVEEETDTEAIAVKSESEEEYEQVEETEQEATGSHEEEKEESDDREAEKKEKSGEYGVYTAEEILKGEGLKDAERIIEEIKMQNETMKKLTKEQEKPPQPPRTCPKCGRIIDGCT